MRQGGSDPTPQGNADLPADHALEARSLTLRPLVATESLKSSSWSMPGRFCAAAKLDARIAARCLGSRDEHIGLEPVAEFEN